MHSWQLLLRSSPEGPQMHDRAAAKQAARRASSGGEGEGGEGGGEGGSGEGGGARLGGDGCDGLGVARESRKGNPVYSYEHTLAARN